jgi:hypothetical protein
MFGKKVIESKIYVGFSPQLFMKQLLFFEDLKNISS